MPHIQIMRNSKQNSTRLYLVAIVIALVALALGMWDVISEQDGGNWLAQLVMPLLLILVVGGLYMRVRAQRIESDESDRGEA